MCPTHRRYKLAHQGSSFTGFLTRTTNTVYADPDGTVQAIDGDMVDVWTASALQMSHQDHFEMQRPVLTTNAINGHPVLTFNNTSGPLTTLRRSPSVPQNHTSGIRFIAVLKVTGGLSVGPPLGGTFDIDNTFAAHGTINEWIGFADTRTQPVKFPLDKYALYAICCANTGGNTSLYINDPNVPVYTDTLSNSGFQTTVWIGGRHTAMHGCMACISLHGEEMLQTEFENIIEAIKPVYQIVPPTPTLPDSETVSGSYGSAAYGGEDGVAADGGSS